MNTPALIVLQQKEARAALLEIAETLRPAAPDQVFRITAAAEFLGVSVDVISRLSAAGEIPCRNVGTGAKATYLYSKNALSRWLAGVD